MGFLDNLEDALKSVERGAEREDEKSANVSRAAELEAVRAAAPNAEALKKGQWTQDFLTHCVTLGHNQRMRVGMAWIGATLRLDAREKRLDLQPAAESIIAIYSVDGVETARESVDLQSDPAAFARKWLATS